MPASCAVCGFDPGEWTEQDLERTAIHADDLVAGWSTSLPDALRPAIEAVEGGDRYIDADDRDRANDDDGELATRVHRLWHRLVSIADVRRANGDAIPGQQGTVTQLSRSSGGVPKAAVESAVVDRRGIVGDVQATRVHHGRPWQALCLWSADVIDALVAEGHPVHAGATGENVTIRGVDWSTWRGGTIIDIGSVRCQLSGPAQPCRKNRRWFIDGDVGRIDHDLRPGWSRWYASVLVPGSITAGARVVVEPTNSAAADPDGTA